MNFLAHVFLARQSDDAMIGALLGDFAKANDMEGYGHEIVREIRIHRRIDSFTDSHPVVAEAKSLFRSDTRRFAGISLDVFYDHVLATDWERYAPMPLDEFTERFYRALAARRHLLPVRAAAVADSMIRHDWLGSYREFDSVKMAVSRMSTRLSRSGDMLRASLVDIEEHYLELARGFHAFFPELAAFAESERAAYEG